MQNADSSKQIVVRFPPSPTGEIHIGNVRTLLFNFLFARQNNGKIVFRFEDTDKERSSLDYEKPMLHALDTLGLSWDEGPYRQSERGEIYKKYLHELVEKGLAYEGEVNAAGTGKIVRLKNIERDISWNDLVKGPITINTHTFADESGNADIIIARSVDDAIYHFTVVVDDWLMGVTHVIRGDDHITSTPRQIMILEALGAPVPQYAHLPTIVGEDRKKLSKRNGTTSLQSFFDLGYLPQTMVNYLALLGWNPGDDREFFTMQELVKEFTFDKCQVSPAQFDFKKLDSINKHYLDMLPSAEYIEAVMKYFPHHELDEKIKKIILLVIRERINKYSEIESLKNSGEFDFYYSAPTISAEKIIFKDQVVHEAQANLKVVHQMIEKIEDENWTVESLKNLLWDWSATIGRGKVLHPLRMCLSGRDKSPDPFTIMSILGKAESLKRIDKIINEKTAE